MGKTQDTVVSISPNGSRPEPFVFGREKWVECDEPGLKGFKIKIKSLTNAERTAVQDANNENVRYQAEYFKMPAPERDRTDSPRRREWMMIAPYVLDWNAHGLDREGNVVPVPAPADAGPDVFDAIEPEASAWVAQTIVFGYSASPKGTTSSDGSPRGAGPTLVGDDDDQS